MLVTFRLSRGLVAALDKHAMQMPVTSHSPPTRSDAARDLMQRALVGTAAQLPPSTSAQDASVLAAAHALERGSGRTLRLSHLRARLAGVRRSVLDRTLFRLEAAGEIALGRVVDLAAVTPADREAAIVDGVRGMLIYVSCIDQNRNTVSA